MSIFIVFGKGEGGAKHFFLFNLFSKEDREAFDYSGVV